MASAEWDRAEDGFTWGIMFRFLLMASFATLFLFQALSVSAQTDPSITVTGAFCPPLRLLRNAQSEVIGLRIEDGGRQRDTYISLDPRDPYFGAQVKSQVNAHGLFYRPFQEENDPQGLLAMNYLDVTNNGNGKLIERVLLEIWMFYDQGEPTFYLASRNGQEGIDFVVGGNLSNGFLCRDPLPTEGAPLQIAATNPSLQMSKFFYPNLVNLLIMEDVTEERRLRIEELETAGVSAAAEYALLQDEQDRTREALTRYYNRALDAESDRDWLQELSSFLLKKITKTLRVSKKDVNGALRLLGRTQRKAIRDIKDR
ncbi:MAG: hypothetical protein KDD70_17850 [Bdellovibrionales bacterium]|nr:hypothetical protein [Bdellovibrionales bacterium]